MGRFSNQVVIISGACGGFGSRTAERMAEEGASLVLSDMDQARLERMAAGLSAPVATLAGDVSDEALSRDLVALAIERFGRLDIAINNAGIAQSFVKLAQLSAEEARRIFDIDLLGVFFAMKHQLLAMESRYKAEGKGGTIVNIASVAGLAGAPKLSVYAAAKHGVVGLTRSGAAEYASRGIRVNAVCPSFARTAMVDAFVQISGRGEAEALDELTRGVPMKRVAEVDEIVEAILFAADPKNSFMNGHALAIDGGITAL
jgi:NAD(P)-dependent dehydrogenase (short-subunit alcohol dehydrogenase family)